jgi:release factor glutamine methyltransferase
MSESEMEMEMNIVLLEKIRQSWVPQPDKPEETPESTLRALHLLATGVHVSAVKAKFVPLAELNQNEAEKLVVLVKQRCSGIPLAHLTGRQHFMGIEMLVGAQALIPRAETELLGYEALSITRSLLSTGKPVTLIDVCTGSGNVVLGIAACASGCRAFGSDVSKEAIELARENAAFIGVAEKVEFRVGDLFEPFYSGEFWRQVDIITCNPPYISSRKVSNLSDRHLDHEPHLAFDGGPYGLNILRRLIGEAPKFLKPQSYLCLEIGIGQGEIVERLLRNSNQYAVIRALVDSNSNIRAFVART